MEKKQETRAQRLQRQHAEMQAKVLARYIAGAATLPHNLKG